MKKRIICFATALLMLASLLSFTACGNSEVAPEEGTITRMTVDINPSVEFIIDDQNKVIAVTALNDDGSVLIAGEAFIGKTPEEATELMVSIATETGYLVKGNAQAGENTVKISVSGDTKYAKALAEKVEKKADEVLEKLDIEGKVEKAEALKTESLRELAFSTSLYTEEEINAMTEEQLYNVIAAGRVETALLLTEDMRKAYYSAKEYEISFAESEETAEIIKAMGGLYTLKYTAYKASLDIYSSAITALDDFRYNTLVSPDSAYQKSLAALRESKTELLKQKTYTASLDVNGEEYANATVTLALKEEDYNKALAAYEELGKKANEALENLIAKLRESEASLRKLEDEIFDENIEEKLQENASAIEAKLNAAKDGFFEQFESAHSEDIATIESALKAQKQQLKEAVAAEQK